MALRAPPPLETPLAVERARTTARRRCWTATLVLEARAGGGRRRGACRRSSVEEAARGGGGLAVPRRLPSRSRRASPAGRSATRVTACALSRARSRSGELFAAAWTPAAEFGRRRGSVDPLFVWTALDCPSSAPAMGGQTIVLASLAAELRAPVTVGEPHVIGSWEIERDGRKHWSGVALWDAAGGVCAAGRALWIELRAEQVRAPVPSLSCVWDPLRSALALCAIALIAAAPARAAGRGPRPPRRPDDRDVRARASSSRAPPRRSAWSRTRPTRAASSPTRGYLWNDPAIQAFSLVHLSGPGREEGRRPPGHARARRAVARPEPDPVAVRPRDREGGARLLQRAPREAGDEGRADRLRARRHAALHVPAGRRRRSSCSTRRAASRASPTAASA